jgi:hypothetical protein
LIFSHFYPIFALFCFWGAVQRFLPPALRPSDLLKIKKPPAKGVRIGEFLPESKHCFLKPEALIFLCSAAESL